MRFPGCSRHVSRPSRLWKLHLNLITHLSQDHTLQLGPSLLPISFTISSFILITCVCTSDVWRPPLTHCSCPAAWPHCGQSSRSGMHLNRYKPVQGRSKGEICLHNQTESRGDMPLRPSPSCWVISISRISHSYLIFHKIIQSLWVKLSFLLKCTHPSSFRVSVNEHWWMFAIAF